MTQLFYTILCDEVIGELQNLPEQEKSSFLSNFVVLIPCLLMEYCTSFFADVETLTLHDGRSVTGVEQVLRLL